MGAGWGGEGGEWSHTLFSCSWTIFTFKVIFEELFIYFIEVSYVFEFVKEKPGNKWLLYISTVTSLTLTQSISYLLPFVCSLLLSLTILDGMTVHFYYSSKLQIYRVPTSNMSLFIFTQCFPWNKQRQIFHRRNHAVLVDEGSGLCLSGMQILKTTDVFFFAINRHFSSPWKPTRKVASSVGVALQERRARRSKVHCSSLGDMELLRAAGYTEDTIYSNKERKMFCCGGFSFFFFPLLPCSKRQAAQRQSASLGYYVNIWGRTYGSEFKGHVVISNGLWMQTNAAGPF